MRILIDGRYHFLQDWLPMLKKAYDNYELPIIDLSGKKEDCEDTDETSGGNDCEDP